MNETMFSITELSNEYLRITNTQNKSSAHILRKHFKCLVNNKLYIHHAMLSKSVLYVASGDLFRV